MWRIAMYIFTCPNCGEKYDGSYCRCQEQGLGD